VYIVLSRAILKNLLRQINKLLTLNVKLVL